MSAAPDSKQAGPRGLLRYLPWLGVLLLAWLLSRFDLPAIGRAILAVKASSVLGALSLFTANMLIKAFRWQRMLAVQQLVLPFRVALAAFLGSQFYGQVTLGRVGELYRAEALIERGVPLGIALSSSVYDRVLDLATVLVLGAASSALVVGNLRAAVLATVAVLGLCALGVAVLRAPSLSRLGPVVALRRALERRKGTRGLLGLLAQLLTGFGPLLRPSFLAEAMLYTLVGWAGYFGSLFVLADGMGVLASRVAVTAAASLGALSALLPVTVSGLGAREAIFVQVLAREHVLGPRAIALSLCHLAVMTAAAVVFGALGLFARHRQQRERA